MPVLTAPHRLPTPCPTCHKPQRQGSACTTPACRARADHLQTLRNAQSRRAQTEARAHKMLGAAARHVGADRADEIVHGIVPHSGAPIVPLSAQRRAGFAAALEQIIAQAFATTAEDIAADHLSHRALIEPEDPMALTIACIGCRGYCCHNGRDRNAFLTPKTIALQRHRAPDMTAAQIKARYLSYLPTHSQRRSCVYHGEQGCALPRPMRADLCNTWRCPEQKALLAQLETRASNRAAIVAICDDHDTAPPDRAEQAVAVSFDAQGGVTVHTDLTLPQLSKPRAKN